MKKNLSLILSICATVVAVATAVCVFCCKPCCKNAENADADACGTTGAIAYFNLDEVVAAYDYAIAQQAAFQKKYQDAESELQRKQTKLENDDKALADKLNKGLMTRSVAEVKYNELQQKAAAFQQEAQKREAELAEEQQVILNNIADAINTYVQNFNEEKGYDLIITTQGNLLQQPVVAANKTLNITQALIEGLNAEYNKK